jgi:hypothetical protein
MNLACIWGGGDMNQRMGKSAVAALSQLESTVSVTSLPGTILYLRKPMGFNFVPGNAFRTFKTSLRRFRAMVFEADN